MTELASYSNLKPNSFSKEKHDMIFLKKVIEGLWNKVDVTQLTKKEQKEKMVQLLSWAATKNNWTVLFNCLQKYPENDRLIEGKLWSQINFFENTYSIEFTFEVKESHLKKLIEAHKAGNTPLLIICSNKPLKEHVIQLERLNFNKNVKWLNILKLNA